MLKLISGFLFVVMFTTGTINGQTLPDPPKPKESRSDLRQVFSMENEKLKNESSVIDVKKMENPQRQQAQHNNWSKTKTTLVVILAVVIVGALYVIVKNTTRCVRRDPPNCSFVDDPDCVCTESAR